MFPPVIVEDVAQSIDLERIATKAIAKLGKLYSDHAHFIYELVQNAADTSQGEGLGELGLMLQDNSLISWNKGRPFDSGDIKAICSVGESTKDLTKIGTHGIGFKSVYWCTDTPEIYSGDICFRICNYIRPETLSEPIAKFQELASGGTTTLLLPFRARFGDEGKEKIGRELQHLNRWSLLFLSQLHQIQWANELTGESGNYTRRQAQHLEIAGANIIELNDNVQTESFLIFQKLSQPPENVTNHLREQAEDEEELAKIVRSATNYQRIEIAFRISGDKIQPVEGSVLFSYLPTEVNTGLRFLIQARYQTTPARDNIVASDGSQWNSWLVEETGILIQTALKSLRDAGKITNSLFETLPNAKDNITESVAHVFKPIRSAVMAALKGEPLIPAETGIHLLPTQVRVPSSRILRTLLGKEELADLSGVDQAAWLNPSIEWQGRTLDILHEAGVREVHVGHVIAWLKQKGAEWFEKKDTAWLRDLLAFLAEQKVEGDNLLSIPLVRMQDGRHIAPNATNEWVFFPPVSKLTGGESLPNDLPLLHADLCPRQDEDNLFNFLSTIGVKNPTPDEVLLGWLLPKYKRENVEVDIDQNRQHLQLFLRLLNAATVEGKNVVLEKFKDTAFLLGKKVEDTERLYLVSPKAAYLPRFYSGDSDLEIFFQNSPNVFFVGTSYVEEENSSIWRELFRSLEVGESPRRLSIPFTPSVFNQTKTITSGTDWKLDGLSQALDRIAVGDETSEKLADALWRLLLRQFVLQGRTFFEAQFTVRHSRNSHNSQSAPEVVPASFCKLLEQSTWVRDTNGKFAAPQTLYAPTNQIQQVLGDSVSYIHSNYDLGKNQSSETALAAVVGIQLTVSVERALARLREISGNAVDEEIPNHIYSFLRNGQMSGREELFATESLLYTPLPQPRWWKSSEAFWEDASGLFGELRGFISPYYPPNLQAFFTSVGMREPGFDDYVQVAIEITLKDNKSEAIRNRLLQLYKRISVMLNENPRNQQNRNWLQMRDGKCWLGYSESDWDFVDRTQLVRDNHNHLARLFQDCLPFWTCDELTNFAIEKLEVQPVSEAQPNFNSRGERFELPEWSERFLQVATLITEFLESPVWREERDPSSSISILPKIQVMMVEELTVSYTLKGKTTEDPEPLQCYFDENTFSIWIGFGPDEERYAKLIGDALQRYYGVRELREFVTDIITSKNIKGVIPEWQRRGLKITEVSPTEPLETSEEEQEHNEQRFSDSQATVVTGEGEKQGGDNDESCVKEAQSRNSISLNGGGTETIQKIQSQNHYVESANSFAISTKTHTANEQSESGAYRLAAPRKSAFLSPQERLLLLAANQINNDEQTKRAGGITDGNGYGGNEGGKGEGPYHQALKEWVCENPEALGAGLRLARREFIFPTGDRVDVLLEDVAGRPVTVEIKPEIIPGDEKGMWQAIKYQHLAAVDWDLRCSEVVTYLVAPYIPDDIKRRCAKYAVKPFEIGHVLKDVLLEVTVKIPE